MKISRLIPMTVIVALLAVVTSSCIEKEPLNTECDIEKAFLPDESMLVRPAEIDDKQSTVTFIVKNYVSVEALAPEFQITPGATISPESGTVQDFADGPVKYLITSEDGEWQKVYEVTIKHDDPIALKYGFEYVRDVAANNSGGIYEEFIQPSETDPAVINMVWASGNAGFAIMNGSKGPKTYPTFQVAEGYVGKCAELITRSTGTFGSMVGMPMAAGNLFIGQFDPQNAVQKPLEATHFGTSFYYVPIGLRGYYKYTPGEKFMQLVNRKPVEVPGRVDECDIYAVFYERTEDMEYLDGNNVLSEDNPNIIAIARLGENERKGAADWTYFDLEFEYRHGKGLDPEKLENGVYALAVVMTSSIEGASFSGAVGSTIAC